MCPIRVMKPSEMLQKLNEYYVEIEAIAQSKESPTMTIITCPTCNGVGRTIEVISIRDSDGWTPGENYQCEDCDGVGSLEY